MKVSLDWLNDYINVKKMTAEKIANDLTLAGLEAVIESESLGSSNDATLEMEITSNRPDWLSHIGVARELSAIYQRKLNMPKAEPKLKAAKSKKDYVVTIENLEQCPFYSAVLLENISSVQTPEFIKNRLEAIGLRAISFLVDITNYVLLEIGQPLHAFDADLIEGDTIYIRPARKGEKIVAIDEFEYELLTSDLVIADAKGAIAIAGVMGGKRTEVNGDTKNVLLESAFFNPSLVRKTSRRLSLVSDSSYRFERRVDPKGVNWGRDRAVELISQYADIEAVSKVYKQGSPSARTKKIQLPLDYIKRVIGISISQKEITDILKNLGLGVSGPKAKLIVDVPSFRPDLQQPIDLIEEIARIYGYDNIPETLPSSPPMSLIEAPVFSFLDKVKQFCVGAGFQEVCNFSLVHEENLINSGWDRGEITRIVNPQHKELSAMRPTLMQGLIENTKRNFDFGSSNISFFEVGHIYGQESSKKLPDELWHLGLALSGQSSFNWKDKPRKQTLFDLKGFVEALAQHLSVSNVTFVESKHPFLSDQALLEIRVGSEPAGVIGQLKDTIQKDYDLSQELFLAEINLEVFFKQKKAQINFSSISNFPSIYRDLALLLPKKIKAQQIIERVSKLCGDLLMDIDVFDVFEGKSLPSGIKSLGITMQFQSQERTLSNEEINALQDKILKDLNAQFEATLR